MKKTKTENKKRKTTTKGDERKRAGHKAPHKPIAADVRPPHPLGALYETIAAD